MADLASRTHELLNATCQLRRHMLDANATDKSEMFACTLQDIGTLDLRLIYLSYPCNCFWGAVCRLHRWGVCL